MIPSVHCEKSHSTYFAKSGEDNMAIGVKPLTADTLAHDLQTVYLDAGQPQLFFHDFKRLEENQKNIFFEIINRDAELASQVSEIFDQTDKLIGDPFFVDPDVLDVLPSGGKYDYLIEMQMEFYDAEREHTQNIEQALIRKQKNLITANIDYNKQFNYFGEVYDLTQCKNCEDVKTDYEFYNEEVEKIVFKIYSRFDREMIEKYHLQKAAIPKAPLFKALLEDGFRVEDIAQISITPLDAKRISINLKFSSEDDAYWRLVSFDM